MLNQHGVQVLKTGWDVYPLLSKEQFAVFQQAGIEPIQAQLLYNRGITTPEAMQAFLAARYDQTPDPYGLIDMQKAVARIQMALEQREHITVYGDYDADGVTSSAMLTRALRTLKHPDSVLDFYIPSRLHEGCGLNRRAIDLLQARGTALIITTDCASSDTEQIAYAESLGIDVIVTDHHHPPEELPAAYAIINPWRPDCTYPERYLCGVGIAFKLAQALFRANHRSLEEEIALLDLVAIGTIADIAPLLSENHMLVRLGLQQLNQTQNAGLQALIQKTGLRPGRIRERDIGYALSPRLNAAGRIKDASIAFQLLTTDSAEEAARYVVELEELNLARQRQTEELMNLVRLEAQQRPTDQVVLVSGENWPEGIIGLVAGRLADELGRPVLVLSKGQEFSRGSARSRPGFDIISALRGCSPLLVRYGGHTQAAGFTIANEHIEELRTHLLQWNAQEVVLPIMPDEPETGELLDHQGIADEALDVGVQVLASLHPVVAPKMVDLVFTRLDQFNAETFNTIQQVGPFGAANPVPVFKIERQRIYGAWNSGPNGRHLRLHFGNGSFQQKGTLFHGGLQPTGSLVGKLVNIIFTLEPSSNPTDNLPFWWKILDVEVVE
jgi:single-stranded-DNA-specific exonuclease